MTKLSPAAQEVFWAFNEAASGKPDDWHYLPAIAAALQATADQVVPEQVEPPSGETEPWPKDYQLMRDAQWEKCQQLRSEILAIAAELKAP